MQDIAPKTKNTNNSRFSKLNHELLVFLVFLLVSLIFWFILTLRNSTSFTIDYKLKINGIPNSVILTSKIPEKVSVKIHGRGFLLLKMMLNGGDRIIDIDYSIMKDNGKALIINDEVWKKVFTKTISNGITISESTLPTIEIFYSNGEHKHVPVNVSGLVSAAKEYMICDIKLQPEFVDIYAPADSYDTITIINTNRVNFNNLKDTLKTDIILNPPIGVKCVPNKVKATICVDLQTTKQIDIPIYIKNIPQNIILKPFPMTATVTYQVSASEYQNIKDEQFNAVIDYSTIKPSDSKCNVILTDIPDGVKNVRYSPHKVDYIIERTIE